MFVLNERHVTAVCDELIARNYDLNIWAYARVDTVKSHMLRKMRQAGIRGSGHGLRHAFASELLRAGTSFSTLQELLGHSHFTSTQVYTKIDLTQLRDVADNDAEDF